jgi:hypothetical protein
MKRYKLFLGGDDKEIERVLTALFSRGFVIGSRNRDKCMETIRNDAYYRYNPKQWVWAVTGLDGECNMVVNVYTSDCFGNDIQTIPIEQFLIEFDKKYSK